MNNKIMILLGGVVCVLLIAFGVLFFMMWTKISALDEKTSITADGGQTSGSGLKEMGPIYSLDSFIVNLDDPKYRKYLRVTMDIELVSEENKKEVESRLPQIRDSILTILPAKHYDEVITVDGKTLLRTEIQSALNAYFDKEIITNIYFTEFVIQ